MTLSSISIAEHYSQQIKTGLLAYQMLLAEKSFACYGDIEDEVTSGQFSPNGEIVVTGSKDKTVRLWDATSGKELQVLRGHQAEVLSANLPNGEIIVTAAKDGTVRLWRCEVCRDVSVGFRVPGVGKPEVSGTRT